MRTSWYNKLISPLSRQALQYLPEQQLLVSMDGKEEYPVISNVPQLLPAVPEPVDVQSEVHQQMSTAFRYREHYQKDAEVFDYFLAYEDEASRHEARRLHEVIAGAVPGGAATILDVGCGNAWVAQHFCARGVEVVSMDIAPRNPEKALAKFPFPNHFALVADVYALPFPADSFDVVIASEIIEHVADPRLFIERLLDVIKPGGRLIVTTPFAEKIPYSLCVHCNRPTPQHAHLHSFSKDSLARLVRRDQVRDLHLQTFSNKALTKLQTHVFLQYLPLGLWRLADRLANALVRKPARLMMTIVKGSRL